MRKILVIAAVAALGLDLCGCAVVAAGGAVVGAGASVVGTAVDVTGDIVSAPFGGGDSSDHKK
jgi:hypothetical protein